SGQSPAGGDRDLPAGIGEADPPREEQQYFLLGRREALAPEARLARDVAEVEHARVLEEELALLGVVEAELREVDLLLVGFGLREVGLPGHVERQAGRDAVLRVEADVLSVV